MVMPFGLTNTLSTFRRLVNYALKDFIERGVEVYLDDNLVHTRTRDERVTILRAVIKQLQKHRLAIKQQKCVFFQSEVEFLRETFTSDGISISKNKLIDIENLKPPTTLKQLQRVIGLLNYCWRFSPRFADTSLPLHNLRKKEKPNSLVWKNNAGAALSELKRDPKENHFMECDASAFAYGAVLMQKSLIASKNNASYYPVGFYSGKFCPA
jgi:Reverse transcriptase (RNA-dependent DNA polymerase)